MYKSMYGGIRIGIGIGSVIHVNLCIASIPTAPRIPPDQSPRRGKGRGVMSLVG